jgi:two-component system alkaline phosphatase synthesis response regulator PhoP
MSLIFIVEDDENISELIVATLKASAYKVEAFGCYDELEKALEIKNPDLILLDIMLPEVSGIDIIGKLKNNESTKNIPVIFLTAKSSEIDKVKGLEVGAEDYITKPFGVLELQARVKTALRRNQSTDTSDFSIDSDSKVVIVRGKKIKLSFKEFELLECLYKNAGIVLSRDVLLDKVWGYNYEGDTTRTVDMHIRSIRQKLSDDPANPEYIETLRGYGYKFIKG